MIGDDVVSLGIGAMHRRQIDWRSRPRALGDFPADAHSRLRQLDFNRTITVCAGDRALYVKRIELKHFLYCDAW